MKISKLKEAYEIAKVQKGYALGKNRALSDAEVADEYGIRSSSLINKVLTGNATSNFVLAAVSKFIVDTSTELAKSYGVKVTKQINN